MEDDEQANAASKRHWPFAVAWCVCLLLLCLYGSRFIRSANIDFRSFYTAGYLVRNHPAEMYSLDRQIQVQHTLTTGTDFLSFYHPPYEAVLYAALPMLTYRHAYFVYILFNMVLLALVFRAATTEFSSTIPLWQPRPGLLLFVFLPVIITVVDGQNSILFLLLLCLTWRQLKSHHDEIAGVLMAIALFKFQIAIPIVLLLTLRRGKRILIGFVPVAAAVAIVCLCIVGQHGVRDYIHVLSGASAAVAKNQMYALGVVPQYMPNLYGLSYAMCRSIRLLNLSIPLAAFSALLLLGVCASKIRLLDDRAAFSIAVLCALLVSYHMYIYDISIAALPVVLVANRVPKYLLGIMLGLPIVLLYCGAAWFFVLSLPVLAFLGYALSPHPTNAYATCPEPLGADTVI